MISKPDRPPNDEGAALIMVLGMVVMVSAILGGLLSFIATTSRGRVPLDATRARQYAADGAIEYAIGQVRDMPNHNTVVAPIRPLRPAEDPCGPYTQPLNGVTIRVDCANALQLLAAGGFIITQRNVIFTACLNTGAACTDATTITRAQVNFEAPEASSASPLIITRTYIQSWSVNG
jgi:hypothetical protein